MATEQLGILDYTGATLSHDRRYRYSLVRGWGAGPELVVVGFNPSTADEHLNDPTVRRCIAYAKRWGYARLRMVNLYALRATDPAVVLHAPDPVGPECDYYLQMAIAEDDPGEPERMVLLAWGALGGLARPRVRQVRKLAAGRPVHALALTKDGSPRHPLYMRADAKPVPYRW